MNDFLESNNVCGQNLLRIVSQGNAIIAELQRLAEMVPSVFRLETKQDQLNYGDLITDFTYFNTLEVFEKRIEADEKLLNKDDELRETYTELLTKFYLIFESVHRFANDLERYLAELDEGVYIQQTIESVLLDYDGKQLLCEALYLMGVILLTLDRNIDGIVRERMLVSYYRYSAHRSTSDSNIDDVCNLIRSTGFGLNSKRPTNYPEDYFKRANIRPTFVKLVIGRLRSDDVYNLLSSYPNPEHRSIGLANQASMLFVALYFSSQILHSEFAVMREIVDKFFSDNYVISVYMGTIVNLIEQWDPYKAAKAALNNTVDVKNIRLCAGKFRRQMSEMNPKLGQLLKEGVLNEENILNRISDHLNTIRHSNVTLRWVMLHTVPLSGDFAESSATKRGKQSREQIANELKFKPMELFELLLNTSEFELRVRDLSKQIINERRAKLLKFKQESYERVKELAEVFSGSKPLNRVEPNPNIQKWFEDFASKINDLEFQENLDANQMSGISRKIIQLIRALKEVQEFEQLESNLQIRQFLSETNNFLHLMIKTMAIREEDLVTQQIIADLSYAWKIIDVCFTRFMQEGIKRDPTLVAKLRASFLKLASALDLPLLRINQASSNDLVSVSQYYSTELVSYVRKVLHIIPETMFALMARIINIQTNSLIELPTRLMKDKLKSCAQLEERFEVAELTNSISVFTEGVLAMKTTLVGVIQIDPKRLLEDGIRRELVKQVASALHYGLIFSSKVKTSELKVKLESLKIVMDGFRRTFEYIQDYVCINGLKMWQEELSRVINYNVEQECNAFMRHKVLDYQSLYQSRSIPIPKSLPLDPYSLNFIGRLVREITRVTDPRNTIYVYPLSAWYDSRTHAEIIDAKLFSLILKNIGVAGTNGLDRLVSFQIVSELDTVFAEIDRNFTRNKSIFECFVAINNFLNNETPNGIITDKSFIAYYQPLINRFGKILARITESIGRIGQLQVIRENLTYQLNMSSKFQARQLSSALQTINSSLMSEFARQCQLVKTNTVVTAEENMASVFKEESSLLFELTNYLEYNGMSDPLFKVYVNTRLPPNLDTILLLVLVAQAAKFTFTKEIHALTATSSSQKIGDAIDGVPFTIGILTVLRQLHPALTRQFLKLTAQFVNAYMESSLNGQAKQPTEIPVEVMNILQFLHHFCVFGKLKRKPLGKYLPEIVLDQFHSLSK